MTLTTPQEGDTIRFSIKAAGEQYQKNEITIPVASVAKIGDLLTSVHVEDNALVVQAPNNTRVTLQIQLQSPDENYSSYSIAQVGKAKATS